mmetsp:Transcript_41862/g.55188  ORF Transcript_41862/g.55188 Transcript_41862/m.55188 type:complete len:96 (+) Transcript_41862:569-856(+)
MREAALKEALLVIDALPMHYALVAWLINAQSFDVQGVLDHLLHFLLLPALIGGQWVAIVHVALTSCDDGVLVRHWVVSVMNGSIEWPQYHFCLRL